MDWKLQRQKSDSVSLVIPFLWDSNRDVLPNANLR